MMSERLVRDLHAYHDGELQGLRRWWQERRIAASPAAQAELERLREVGAALRTQAEQTRNISGVCVLNDSRFKPINASMVSVFSAIVVLGLWPYQTLGQH